MQIDEAFKTEQETSNQIMGGVANLRNNNGANAENVIPENGRMRTRSSRNHEEVQ